MDFRQNSELSMDGMAAGGAGRKAPAPGKPAKMDARTETSILQACFDSAQIEEDKLRPVSSECNIHNAMAHLMMVRNSVREILAKRKITLPEDKPPEESSDSLIYGAEELSVFRSAERALQIQVDRVGTIPGDNVKPVVENLVQAHKYVSDLIKSREQGN